jgi:predicted amidohydrolase
MTSIRAASVQFQHKASDKAYNLHVMSSYVEEARNKGIQILAFPEMCITGYWHIPDMMRAELDALSEEIPNGKSVTEVRRFAAESGMIIGAGLLERDAGNKLYNSYIVAMPDGTYSVHRKIHAFEHAEISSGEAYTVFDTPLGVRIGVLICWDNNLVENARATALLGADILLAPHQTGGCNSRSPHAMGLIDVDLWRNRLSKPEMIEKEFRGPKGREWLMRWLPARAHDNGLFLVFSNGVGEDHGEVRTGNAMILDPYGRILAETWVARNEMVTADLDLSLLPLATGRRWIRGRKPALYSLLTKPQGHELSPQAARFSKEPVGRMG